MIDKEDSLALADAIVSAWQPQDLQHSPGGSWLAWTATPYGVADDYPVSAIWVAPADGSSSARQFTSGHANDARPRWSPSGNTLTFLSDRNNRGTAGLFQLPVDGGEARELVSRKTAIQTFAWSPDGQTIALTSPDELTEEEERRETERDDPNVYGERWPNARLFLLNAEFGDVRQCNTGDVHVRDVIWSPDGNRIAFFGTETPELESYRTSVLFTVGTEEEKAVEVCSIAGIPSNLQWSSDGSTLCFVSLHDSGISAMTVFAVQADGGEPRVIGPSDRDDVCVTALRPVADSSRLLMAVADGLSTRLEWIDPATGSREHCIAPDAGDIAPDFCVSLRTDETPVFGLIQSTGTEPPEVHAGSIGSLKRISDHHRSLSGFRFGEQEPFYWTSSDGLELDGVLIRPPDAVDGPLPTIVHIHGGPYGRYTAGWNLRPGHWAQWLAVHGYAVLMPNYRGGQGHGNRFAKWGEGGVGDMEFTDVIEAVDAAIDRGIVDPDRLGVGGWSQGGFLTAWAVTQTDRFRAGVMGAGVSDWGMMVMTSDIPTMESQIGGGRPWDGPGPHRFMKHSPISYAGNVRTPLLLLHGEQDARVPVSQAIGFHRALRETGVETELVTYPREPHGIREASHQRDQFIRVRDWFARFV